MPTQMSELKALNETLRHILSVFSKEFPFLDCKVLCAADYTAGVRIKASHEDQPLFMHIDPNNENGGFRISIPIGGNTAYPIDHIFLVPQGTEQMPDRWITDWETMNRNNGPRPNNAVETDFLHSLSNAILPLIIADMDSVLRMEMRPKTGIQSSLQRFQL